MDYPEMVRVKLYNKQSGLEALSKIMGYCAPIKAELSGTFDIEQITGMKVE